jgi:hypothetical protein
MMTVVDDSGKRACPAVGLSQLLDTSGFSTDFPCVGQRTSDNRRAPELNDLHAADR